MVEFAADALGALENVLDSMAVQHKIDYYGNRIIYCAKEIAIWNSISDRVQIYST